MAQSAGDRGDEQNLPISHVQNGVSGTMALSKDGPKLNGTVSSSSSSTANDTSGEDEFPSSRGAYKEPRPSSVLSKELPFNQSHTGLSYSHGVHRSPSPSRTRQNSLRPQMLRSASDYGLRSESAERSDRQSQIEEGSWLRHGWEDTNRGEYLALLTSRFYMYFTDKRHETGGNPSNDNERYPLTEWRMRDRLKTVSAAITLCLNIGVDPPDVVKTNPCARTECWVDPQKHAVSNKAMELIGKNLQNQYESLSIRTRYRQYLDPSVEETKKFCCQLRRNAKDERILFHYNGHGVPKPTSSGEIWVFNKNFTQYIPISLYDLQSWLGAPSLFVYDCSDAGNIVSSFNRFIEKHESENADIRHKDPNAQVQSHLDCIQLAACGKKENLPTNPDLPADLFTCCLTTPISIALRFFVLQSPLPHKLSLEDVERLPGSAQERRTPKGELNWIFTAITDTIAWNMLPRALFKKLFRQDLMVAALFRNFLLSQRIMRTHNCHPQSSPALPETHQHPLWQSWDLAVEMVLAQLPQLLDNQDKKIQYEYKHSSFFSEQLSAFEVYLNREATSQKPPDQLPILLQVLLSQVHRLRALILLSRFLDQGPWAVNLALSIGIFPYVLKLLQSAASELKPVMIFIWARILAVDQSCQADLLKDNGYSYFVNILNPSAIIPIQNDGEHRAMCAFIIASFCKGFHQGQVVCLGTPAIKHCLAHLNDMGNPLLRQFACLCISQLWVNYADAKWQGIRDSAHLRLCDLAYDPVPEVRTAMLYAMNNFLGIPEVTDQVAHIEEIIASSLLVLTNDGSSMVRKELLIFFSTFVKRYENKLLVAAYEQLVEERQSLMGRSQDDASANGSLTPSSRPPTRDSDDSSQGISNDTIFGAIWKHLLIMSVDPYPEVSEDASAIVDHVHQALLKSPLANSAQFAIDDIIRLSLRAAPEKQDAVEPPVPVAQRPQSPSKLPDNKDGYFTTSLKRTASVAASLKSLAFGAQTHQEGSSTPSSVSSVQIPLSEQQHANRPHRNRTPAEWKLPPDQNDTLSTPATYAPAKVPLPRRIGTHFPKEIPMLPLTSNFLEWSLEYFREPQMKPSEPDEPGSLDYNARLWRRNRNEKIMAETQPLKEHAGSHPWNVPSGLLLNNTQPNRLFFHQFENHLVAADDRDTLCVWDWDRQIRLSRFSNGNPAGSKMNDVRFINEDDQALLMTGSSDGVIRIFRGYDSESKVELVGAWRALTNLLNSDHSTGLVFDWQQGQGKALAAGDVKVIRIWNAATEMCTYDIPARSGSCITSLTSDQVSGNVFVAGFADGALRVYDQRQSPRDAMVKVWKDHRQWITNVHMQRGGLRELVSGSRNGDVKLWDIRMDRPLRSVQCTKNNLRSLSVHEHAPIFAM